MLYYNICLCPVGDVLRKILISIFAPLLFAVFSVQAHAGAEMRVVASIKPVHSLVAAIMQGVGRPALILDGAGTPHSYALKPSKARLLAKARIVFWIGPGLETFLQKPVQTIASAARSVELGKSNGLVRHEIREFDSADVSGAHSHDAHDTFDPHFWLDPQNAKVMSKNISAELIKADPKNAETYQKNTEALMLRLGELQSQTQALLANVSAQPFITYHDGYQYFEARFGLNSHGAIVVNPEISPGAKRILQIREKLKFSGNICLFTEPQFSQNIISAVSENTEARVANLDPLGSKLAPGPGLYFELIKAMAKSFHECLSSIAK